MTNCYNYPNWDPILNKDDTGVLLQISFTILLLYTLGLGYYTCKNLSELFTVRHMLKVDRRIIMNIGILIYVFIVMGYSFDGFLMLIGVPDGYLDLQSWYVLNYSQLGAMELCFIFATFNWALPLGNAFLFDKDKARVYRLAYAVIMTISLIIPIVAIDLNFGLTSNICQTVSTYDNGLAAWVLVLVFVMEINNLVVSICCYLLANKIQVLYDYKDTKATIKMKYLAIFTAFGLTFRAIRDALEAFDMGPFDIIEREANTPGAPLSNQVPWAIVNLLFELFCGMLPMTFLMLNFSVSVRQRMHSNSVGPLVRTFSKEDKSRMEPLTDFQA